MGLKTTVLLSVMLSFAAAASTLYKVVNEDGSITYTDIPAPGAEPVDLSKVNSAVMPSLTTNKQTNPQVKPTQKPTIEYQLSLISPTQEQTVRDNLGNLTVRAKLSPQSAGMFQLVLDGEVVQTQPQPVFELTNLNRGEHTIQVHFLQNRGKILASTPSTVFYLRRASALINPN